ncbi:VOC family protein [Alkalimonas sp. NCh-2]|uniref:VOC family protein n=1 Tax=Alkalimonas sp. NCh-2 TaxID=3144846 RepID=UPI0031F6D424
MSQVQAIPEGYSGAIPYLTIKNAADAIGFYQKAFGAKLIVKMEMPGGGVMHAEMRVGQALFMLSEQNDDWGTKSPSMLDGTPVGVMIYVKDVDALVEQAVAAGATLTMPPADQFYGDRMACLQDPFGHSWMFSTHIEDVSEPELERRAKEMFGG